MKTMMKVAAAAAALMIAATVAQADVLENIKKSGKVRIAVAMGSPEYSYVDSDLKATGSDVETARLIAKDLGVKLDLVEITNAARVPTVQTGRSRHRSLLLLRLLSAVGLEPFSREETECRPPLNSMK